MAHYKVQFYVPISVEADSHREACEIVDARMAAGDFTSDDLSAELVEDEE